MGTAKLSLDEYQRRALAVERAECGDVLQHVAASASQAGLSVEEITLANLDQTCRTFGADEPKRPHPQSDADEQVHQRLSERLVMRFDERVGVDGRLGFGAVTRSVRMDGEAAFRRVGAPVDGMSSVDDYWRYDLAFHLGYLAVLGWSPVIGAIRDSTSRQAGVGRTGGDETESRPVVVERVLTTGVFAVAAEHSFFDTASDVPYYVMRWCMRSTQLDNFAHADWEQAILVGYHAFRFLIEHRSGVLVADLSGRTLTPYTVEQYESTYDL